MALLPPQYLDAVMALGRETDGGVQWIASGFFYLRLVSRDENEERGDYKAYLVTNRHVVEDMARLIIRTNPVDGQAPRDYPLDLIKPDGSLYWTGHPDPEVDVAVVAVNFQRLKDDGMQVEAVASDKHVADRNAMRELGIGEGDSVYLLGFPMGLVGDRRASVIVRSGVIARAKDLLAGSERTFLVDASVFPGNSGGPVALRPEITSITGTGAVGRAHVIGVVSGYITYEDVAVSVQTGNTRVVFSENSGLVAVYPMEFVTESIDADPTWAETPSDDPRDAVEEIDPGADIPSAATDG